MSSALLSQKALPHWDGDTRPVKIARAWENNAHMTPNNGNNLTYDQLYLNQIFNLISTIIVFIYYSSWLVSIPPYSSLKEIVSDNEPLHRDLGIISTIGGSDVITVDVTAGRLLVGWPHIRKLREKNFPPFNQ